MKKQEMIQKLKKILFYIENYPENTELTECCQELCRLFNRYFDRKLNENYYAGDKTFSILMSGNLQNTLSQDTSIDKQIEEIIRRADEICDSLSDDRICDGVSDDSNK